MKTVLDFLDDEWEGDRALEGEARLLLAQAHRMTGDVDPALKEAEAAGTILERENQKSRAVAALLLAAEAAWQARKVEETTRLVQRVMASARNAGDSESLHHVLSLAATVANLRGEYEKANEYLEEAGRLAGEVKESDVHEEIPKGGKLVVALPTPVGVVEPVNMELVEEQEIDGAGAVVQADRDHRLPATGQPTLHLLHGSDDGGHLPDPEVAHLRGGRPIDPSTRVVAKQIRDGADAKAFRKDLVGRVALRLHADPAVGQLRIDVQNGAALLERAHSTPIKNG